MGDTMSTMSEPRPICGAASGKPCHVLGTGQLRLPHFSRRYGIGALAPPGPRLR